MFTVLALAQKSPPELLATRNLLTVTPESHFRDQLTDGTARKLGPGAGVERFGVNNSKLHGLIAHLDRG